MKGLIVKKMLINFLSACFFVFILVLPGCGSSSSNNSTYPPTIDKPKTVEVSPAEALNDVLKNANSGTYTLALRIYGLESSGCEISWSSYTQKGNNYRLNRLGGSASIYNDVRKQGAMIGILENTPVSEGWLPPDEYITSKPEVVWDTLIEASGTDLASLTNFNITKSSDLGYDVFLLQNKYMKTYTPGDTRFILYCNGPGGLPSSLSKQVDDYGANKGSNTLLVEFTYTNFNNVPDSMFELPSDAKPIPPGYSTGKLTHFDTDLLCVGIWMGAHNNQRYN